MRHQVSPGQGSHDGRDHQILCRTASRFQMNQSKHTSRFIKGTLTQVIYIWHQNEDETIHLTPAEQLKKRGRRFLSAECLKWFRMVVDPYTHLFLEHTEGARDLLHISGDVASTYLKTLEPANSGVLDSYQV